VANILHDAPLRWNPCAYPQFHIHFRPIFLASKSIGLHFATNDIGLPSFQFFWWAPQDFAISNRGRFRRSRSSKVTEWY